MADEFTPSRLSEDPSDSFCVLPWMHVFADESGVMYPCCRSVGSQLPNVDEDGQPYRIQDEGRLVEGWNSAYMRKLRLDMLEARRPRPCERCYMYDDLGIRSHRLSANTTYRSRIAEFLARGDDEQRVPLDLHSVDLRLGNLCNLRCRMCSPQSSKALIQEWADLYRVPSDHEAFDRFRRLDWFSSESFWKIFEKHTPQLEWLHFAGGEPLLVPQMFDFLQRLVELGRAEHITLNYTTNGTALPKRIYELWPHFQNVRVTVSLDGFDKVNSFIRHPANWRTIDRNLRILDEHADQLNCSGGLGLNTTVQMFNIFRLDDLLRYVAKTLRRFEPPNLTLLTYPEHFSIQLLPPAMKNRAMMRLRAFLDSFSGHWPEHWEGAPFEQFMSRVEGVFDHLMSADRSDAIPEFRRWTEHQDQFRGQNVCEVIPELAPLFEPSTTMVRTAHGDI